MTMKVIGLTGGIGTGKTTVSEYLKSKGCKIIDADEMSRQMTSSGSPALKEIEIAFGKKYIYEDGSLNRKALGDLVFNDKNSLAILQNIITKKVVEQIDYELIRIKNSEYDGVVVLDAPLLFECGMGDLADENWLVVAGLKERIERVMNRDGLSQAQVLERINNQMPQEEKEKLSDCIIQNIATIEYVNSQVDSQLERIKNEG